MRKLIVCAPCLVAALRHARLTNQSERIPNTWADGLDLYCQRGKERAVKKSIVLGASMVAALAISATSAANTSVSARHSAAQLERLTLHIAHMRFGSGIRLAQWGPDPRSNTVRIWLAHYTAAKARRIKRQLPPGWVSVVAWHGPLLSTLGGRDTDHAPFLNGDRIYIQEQDGRLEFQCTDAFAITTRTGRYGLTAGHCGGKAIYTNKRRVYLMGRVTYKTYSNHGYDLEEFKCDCAAPVWYGKNAYHSVVNWKQVKAGTGPTHEVTFDGATTGEVGGATVTQNRICARLQDPNTGEFHTTCHLDEAGGYASSGYCHSGDSGGPVYQRAPHNSVYAAGVIIGGNRYTGTPCVYQRIIDTLDRLQAHLVKGSRR